MKKTTSDNYNISETEYAGNFIYEDGQLRMFFQPEGYVEPDGNGGYGYVYQYIDIWGNVRLSYKNIGTSSSPNLQIQDEKNYYPFGMEHQGYNGNLIGNENNYQTYQNKEMEKELGLNWHDFGARRFQSDIARWTTLDPLAEKFYSWSPYTGMNDNPVMFTDPTGMASEDLDVEFETSDVDVMVNIGYGRKMASSQFGGAMSFSGGTPVLSSSGEGKLQGVFGAEIQEGGDSGENNNCPDGDCNNALHRNSDKAIPLDKWVEKYGSWSQEDIALEAGKDTFGLPNGPDDDWRYVINPYDGNVMDMRHVVVVGYGMGEVQGLGAEIIQKFFGLFGLDKTNSAFNPQDKYSNNIGAAFHTYDFRKNGINMSFNFGDNFNEFLSKVYKQ